MIKNSRRFKKGSQDKNVRTPSAERGEINIFFFFLEISLIRNSHGGNLGEIKTSWKGFVQPF